MKCLTPCLILVAASAQALPYSLTYLAPLPDQGFSTAYGISSRGQAVGSSGYGDFRPVEWVSGGVATNLGLLPGATVGEARAINGTGQIAGYSTSFTPTSGTSRPTLYTPGLGLQDLGGMPGKERGRATAIDESGQVAGYVFGSGNSTAGQQAFLWSPGNGMVGLKGPNAFGQTIAWGMNDLGQVVGQTTGTSDSGAAFWDVDGSLTMFGRQNPYATDVNNSGQAVGALSTNDPNVQRAFVWTRASGARDLGTLLGYASASASAINERGAIVGSSRNGFSDLRATLWTAEGGVVDLNSLIDPSSGFFLETATGINDAGQIIGYGALNGLPQRAFLLTPNPVPEPASLCVLGTGSFGVLRRRRTGIKR